MPRSRSITVFLLKSDDPDPVVILKRPHVLRSLTVMIDGQEYGRLYIQTSQQQAPSWISLFHGHVDLDHVDTFNASTAAVWVLAAGGRLLALVFGYGRNLLKPGSWEEDFGLRITLNGVDPKRIKSIDRMTLDSISQQSRIQASRDASIDEFGLDVEQDLLRAVTGAPSDPSLGSRLTGKDALQANLAVTLRDLPAFLVRLLEESQKEDYKANYPWVAQIHEVNDVVKRAELDAELIDKLRRRDLTGMWLAVPEMLEWEGLAGFRYRSSRQAPVHEDIHISTFLEDLGAELEIDEHSLKKRWHVWAIRAENDAVIRQWPVYRCLYCELASDAELHLLHNGRWFRVAADFVQRITEAVDRIPECQLEWPDYNDGSEAAYCQRMGRGEDGRFAVMDRQLVRYNGLPNPVEFCDLFSRENRIVHLKRYGGSSALSHLFAQGVVSAKLFLAEPNFRTALNNLLPVSHRLADPNARPTPSEYEIVYGIISHSRKKLVLPFFSRVNLKNAYSNLSGLGFRVSLAKIAAGHD